MLEKGTVISRRYQIVDKLGAGGMAVAYKAKDMRLGRYVTVKVLKDEYAENDEFLLKFSTEASAAASLSNHNIVRVFDVGEDNGINYIVMEYVHGQSLKKTIEEKAPFDNLTTLSVAMQIASALSHAHKHHVVHRDIKPQNILVSVDGTVKVTDFGIARAATTNTYAADVNAMGSVHYFSPEQARGGYVNEKSDIYSLGITMFEMATGRVPFNASSSIGIALKHLNEELPDIKQFNPDVTRGLEGIIRKATQKKSDERYDNIDLLMSDLKLAIIEAARVAKAKSADKSATVNKTNLKKDIKETHVAAVPIREVKAAPVKAVEEIENFEGQLSLDDIGVETCENRKIEAVYIDKEEFEKAKKIEEVDEEFAEEFEEIDDYDEDEFEEYDEDYEEEKEIEIPKSIRLPKSSVGFNKYSKKLNLNNQNDSYDDDDFDDDDDYDDDDFDDYYREYDEEERQERKVTIAAIITSLIIIAAIIFVGVKFFNVFDNAAAVFNFSKSVPNFVGMTMTEATEKADKLGITIVEGDVVDSLEAEDVVLTQNVEEGTDVTQNMEIIVTVSSGKPVYPVPDVTGLPEADAIKAITSAAELKANIIIEYEQNPSYEKGTVIRQKPEATDYISEKSDIILTICKEEDNINAVVPNVEGYSEADAKAKITSSGLAVGNVSYTTSTTVEKGLVIKQTANPGDEILKNSTIDIVVSSGRPAPVVTKPVTNNQSSSNQTSVDVDSDVPALGSME